MGLVALAIGLLAGPASAVRAGDGQRAAVPGDFDDWKPSGRKETLPRAQPAPTPRPTPKPKPGGRLGYSAILGSWCSPASSYQIERKRLIVLLNDGKRVVFPVTGYKFTAATVEISWTSKGESKRTIFGRFSPDRRRMDQFGVNRTYIRC